MKKSLEDWRNEGKHLPEFLRDFHDQKEFFNFLHEFNDLHNHDMLKDIDPMKGHIYSLDVLLWSLARFGYTLQKSRAQVEFNDLDEMVKKFSAVRREKFFSILNNLEAKKDE